MSFGGLEALIARYTVAGCERQLDLHQIEFFHERVQDSCSCDIRTFLQPRASCHPSPGAWHPVPGVGLQPKACILINKAMCTIYHTLRFGQSHIIVMGLQRMRLMEVRPSKGIDFFDYSWSTSVCLTPVTSCVQASCSTPVLRYLILPQNIRLGGNDYVSLSIMEKQRLYHARFSRLSCYLSHTSFAVSCTPGL